MPHFGVYTALVTQVDNDPEGEARVQIALPPALVQGEVRAFARLATLHAGQDRGTFFLPDPGDEVLVAFEGGDLWRPIILGSLWSAERPPPMAPAEANSQKAIHLRSGLRLHFDERPGQAAITLETPGGRRLTLQDGAAGVRLQESGGNSITLTQDGVVVTARSLTLQAEETVTITGKRDVRIKAAGGLELEGGTNVKIESPGSVNIKAGGLTILDGGSIVIDGQVYSPRAPVRRVLVKPKKGG